MSEIKRYYHVGHTEQYEQNYDEIFGKKETPEEIIKEWNENKSCINCKYSFGDGAVRCEDCVPENEWNGWEISE